MLRGKYSRGGPLGNYQFTAAFFFERHGVVESDDGALGLLVGGRLRRDALQPKAGRGHQGKERAAVFGGETDDFVGDAGNHRQQHDPRSETRPECGEWNQHVKADGDQHDRHEKAGAASRMEGRILLDFGGLEPVSVFEGEYGFVLGSVILVNTANVFPERDSPDEEQEQDQTDGAIDQVEYDSPTESRVNLLQFR